MQFAMPAMTPAVKLIVLINAVAFLVTFAIFLAKTEAWLALRDVLGLSPAHWIQWAPILPFWQLLSYGFLHDPSRLMHILMNMLFLYFLGTMLEATVGARRFLTLYLSAIVVAGAAMLVTGLFQHDPLPTIGASGGVLAVVVAMAVLRPKTRVIFLIFPITLKTLAILYVGLDVFGALMELKGQGGGVAHMAHLSGAAWGFLLARRGWIWQDPFQGLQRWQALRVEEKERDSERRLDELLAKIHREGIQSLSVRERAFLKRTSKRP